MLDANFTRPPSGVAVLTVERVSSPIRRLEDLEQTEPLTAF